MTLAMREIGSEFDDEIEDETLSERLWALTEMFPPVLRNATGSVIDNSRSAVSFSFSCFRTFIWHTVTVSTFFLLPAIIMKERDDVLRETNITKRNMLLGPGSSVPAMPNQHSTRP